MHPEDFIRVVKDGARLELADMKYGYPHKLYVHGIPNPLAGQECEVGTDHNDGKSTPILGKASASLFAKFYTRHFSDEGTDDAARAELNEAFRHVGFEFQLQAGTIRWAHLWDSRRENRQ